MYASEPEASKIPPTWHIWLHHMSDALPDAEDTKKYPWQKPHTPNLSGTNMAYFPPGHAAKGGNRYNVESDYEAWKP